MFLVAAMRLRRHRWLLGLSDEELADADTVGGETMAMEQTKAKCLWKLLSTNEFQAARALVDTVHTLRTAKTIMITLDACGDITAFLQFLVREEIQSTDSVRVPLERVGAHWQPVPEGFTIPRRFDTTCISSAHSLQLFVHACMGGGRRLFARARVQS